MKVFLISFGSPTLLKQMVCLYGLNVDGIITSSSFPNLAEGDQMENKNDMIHYLRREHGIRKPLLVDTSRFHLRAAQLENIATFLVKEGDGLTPKEARLLLFRLVSGDYDGVFLEADHVFYQNNVTRDVFLPSLDRPHSLPIDVTGLRLGAGILPFFAGLSSLSSSIMYTSSHGDLNDRLLGTKKTDGEEECSRV